MKRARYLFAKLIVVLTAGILPLFMSSAAATAAEPFFKGLGDLPGRGFNSEANGVSADGSVVVGVGRSANGTEAFHWTQAGGMVGLGDLPGGDFTSYANGVSDDGLVVVGGSDCTVACSPGAGCRSLPGAFRWTPAGGMTLLGDDEYRSRSIADGVSADGSVVVGTRSGMGIPGGAFRWTPNTVMEYLPDGDTALGVSPDGAVAVGFGYSELGTQALRWRMGDGMLPLGDLPGGSTFNSRAYGVSADGSVVVGYGTSATATEAVRWTQASGMVGLGILPGFNASLAQDVSADGSLVVGYSGDDWFTPGEAFLWDATHGMRSLRELLINDFGLGARLAGWTLTSANDISADGQFIVGSGINPNGNTEAWLARLAFAPMLPGDFNHNGTVDAADYVVWRNNPTSFGGDPAGYITWRANFGQTGGSGAALSPSAVPEPTSALLVIFAAAVVRSRGRRIPSNVPATILIPLFAKFARRAQ
jgi:probable HAF family extracellular repeat protein